MGQRTDPSYWRVYDKGVESKTAEPGRVWRIELEAKGTLAEELCRELKEVGNVAEWSWSCCESQWRSEGFCWPLPASEQERVPVRAPAVPIGTLAQQAVWLTRTCRPVVVRMLKLFTVEEVLEILGLTDVAQPRRRRDVDGE